MGPRWSASIPDPFPTSLVTSPSKGEVVHFAEGQHQQAVEASKVLRVWKKSDPWAESSRWEGGQKVRDGKGANLARKLKMVGFTQQVVGRQQLEQKVTESLRRNHPGCCGFSRLWMGLAWGLQLGSHEEEVRVNKDSGALSRRDGVQEPGMAADAGAPRWGPVLGDGGLGLSGMWVPTMQWGSTFHLCYRQRSKNGKVIQEDCSKPPKCHTQVAQEPLGYNSNRVHLLSTCCMQSGSGLDTVCSHEPDN